MTEKAEVKLSEALNVQIASELGLNPDMVTNEGFNLEFLPGETVKITWRGFKMTTTKDLVKVMVGVVQEAESNDSGGGR